MSVTDEFDPEFERVQQVQAKKDTESKDEIARDLLDRRRLAYTRMFTRGKANETDIAIVMEDLEIFCRGEESAFHMNDRIHCLQTGRQEVYMRIKDHTRLPLDQLVEKYTKPQRQE